ncbi:hypothetical protein DOTSEDRAFT_67827 [Dothistroma septosporum NZE10]|uniref:WSC domain-containing protein n=1 Tax=Dothistroma septosporum (strain NZE10 / CBS 128990) TaxID=675120 RepID=N1Q0T8_DOTSN|nr:hypothetical protein DOTSEDRAFT_67827 [Dothistroma septosporum NZE10]
MATAAAHMTFAILVSKREMIRTAPSLDATSTSVDNNPYAGNMTYRGCWSGQAQRTLTDITYQSDANTIELCTQTCASGDNTIAGLEATSQCYCGTALAYIKRSRWVTALANIPALATPARSAVATTDFHSSQLACATTARCVDVFWKRLLAQVHIGSCSTQPSLGCYRNDRLIYFQLGSFIYFRYHY